MQATETFVSTDSLSVSPTPELSISAAAVDDRQAASRETLIGTTRPACIIPSDRYDGQRVDSAATSTLRFSVGPGSDLNELTPVDNGNPGPVLDRLEQRRPSRTPGRKDPRLTGHRRTV